MYNENGQYQLLDIIKYISALLVIGLHTRPFLSINRSVDNIFNYDIANFAVPFFYACTGFFLVKFSSSKLSFESNVKLRIKKVFKLYVVWTLLYFPLTICGWQRYGGITIHNMITFVRNFLFVGENYYSWHLWYLNGLIVALILIYMGRKKFTIKQLFICAIQLYVVGLLIQLANNNIEVIPHILSILVKCYYKILFTTRNGLFRTFVFVLIGMMIAERMKKGKKFGIIEYCFGFFLYIIKFLFSMLGGDGTMFNTCCQILDLPIMYVLFEAIINMASNHIKISDKVALFCRALSGNIYYVHMYFVALCALVLMGENGYNNLYSFFIVVVSSNLFGLFMIFTKKYFKLKHTKSIQILNEK